jgi:hypothetical protein
MTGAAKRVSGLGLHTNNVQVGSQITLLLSLEISLHRLPFVLDLI